MAPILLLPLQPEIEQKDVVAAADAVSTGAQTHAYFMKGCVWRTSQ